MSKVTTQEFEKAIISLEETLGLYKNAEIGSPEAKAFRDACIQRFENCIELSWKTAMKVLGSTTSAVKIAVREMARNNLIADPQIWFDFIEARNNSSHSFDEGVAVKVLSSAQSFPTEAKKLLINLKKQ